MKVLFLASYPVTAAATRFRLHQYFPHLQSDGIECVLSPYLKENDFATLYDRRSPAQKAARLLQLAVRRVVGSLRSSKFDLVYVQREAMLMGPPIVEWIVARLLRIPLVFDFDDAIWVAYESPTYGRLATLLKFPKKTHKILEMARHIVVASESNRKWVSETHARNDVTVIPTVVDADEFSPAAPPFGEAPVVGWIGTHSTARLLESIGPALSACARRNPFRLHIVGAGRTLSFEGVDTQCDAWSLEREPEDYRRMDVGLHPVPDDEWNRGKAGFKAIGYMSCGVPVISSPVGGVTEFLQHGVNGMFANSQSEWEQHLTAYLQGPALRRAHGSAGRKTVLARYCLQRQAPVMSTLLRQVAAR